MEEMELFLAGLIGDGELDRGGGSSLRSRRWQLAPIAANATNTFPCALPSGAADSVRAVDTPISAAPIGCGHNRRWFWRMALLQTPPATFTGDSMARC